MRTSRTSSRFRILPAALAALTLASPSLFTTMMNDARAADGPPPQPNAAQIQQRLARLGVVGSVLYVAAHPDDENTSLLAYLANGALLRTGYLSITRGDGGQNLIGSEQGPELGLIRTQELLAARRIDGAEQFFTRARDFGYSKGPEETLRIWGKDAVLADVAWVIRRFRPDAIVTRFSPEPSETHGHHTASAMLAVEAFKAAADPHFHPEQLTGGVTPWQARRILWNKSTFLAKPGDDFAGFDRLDVGGYNALLGTSYGEMAAESRSMHKSQGFGVARSRGPNIEYFKVLAQAADVGTPGGAAKASASASASSILMGVDASWGRWPGTLGLQQAIDHAQRQWKPTDPAATIPALLEIDTALEPVPDAGWRVQKKKEVRELVLACAGLFADATAADYRVAPGASIEVTATAVNRSRAPITLREVRFPAAANQTLVPIGRALGAPAAGGGAATPVDVKQTVVVSADEPLSTPYWLATPPGPGLYAVGDPRLIGAPEEQPSLHVDFVFDVGTRTFVVERPIVFKWTDPVAGERYRPLEITPAVSVRPDTNLLMFPARPHHAQALTVHLVAGVAGVTGTVRPEAPAGFSVEPASAPFKIAAKGEEAEVVFHVRVDDRRATAPTAAAHAAAPAAAATLRVVADVGGAKLTRGVVRIEHPHIPVQTWLADADVRLVPLALETRGTKIGYIPGPGDEVAASLRRVGYDVTSLSEATLRAGAAALAPFDAIVVGVRAFNTSERLRAAHAALMKYVESGGTLVVQYNTNSRLGPLTAPIGPFPLEIGHDRVTDETAAVTFATPAHPVLNTPNKITAADFDGWIQERGLYFAEKWDPKYQAPLSLHDPGEKPSGGSLLWARHGKGTFVYTGLAFFRQLPAGVPGAYRLFANLIARSGGTHAAP